MLTQKKLIKMNSTFTNVALFIKRAEEYQTKEFIIEAFDSNNIGKVKDVKFIKKQNDTGTNYNGVIVIFERWNMNRLVETLFSEMAASPDGTTKFYFNPYRYWIINVHRQKLPECEETTIVDSSLSDKDKISKLEELVKSMSTQMFYMQNRQEKSERTIMDFEHKEIRHHLINVELRSQLEEKDLEKKWAEDKLNEEIAKLREENEMLRARLAFSAIDLVRKDTQCEKLEEEAEEMKVAIRALLDTDPVKPVVIIPKEYID